MKAIPILIDNRAEIWAAVSPVLQWARRAKREIPADAATRCGAVDASASNEAIRKIEDSLVTLNAQMGETGDLVASLTRQNEALQTQVEKLQGWVVGLAALSGLSLPLAVVAILIALAR